ncbi:hypothetical protein SCHPADRAFT_152173 [Schizopora paradoxa]|uniref:Uncharacterized protein n=1 Tax=Schizopora paradoxa TaxID=27342 RepID=A0A0H2S197_9AGAM|nr:hypothetical protein SCHPADRAFT_152173 [Schizopora paradoxa]
MSRRFEPLKNEQVCSENTELILKYTKEVFENRESESFSSSSRLLNDRITSPGSQTLSSTMEGIEKSIFTKNMEICALRRALVRSQQDLKTLESDRSNHYLQIDRDKHSSSNLPKLPRLPEEILSRIFSTLYFLEVDLFWDDQTIRKLLNEADTPIELKELIRKEVPVVVLDDADPNFDNDVEGNLGSIENIVGSSPKVLAAEALDGFTFATPRRSVTVLVHRRNWPSAEQMKPLSRVYWEKLIVRYHASDDIGQRDFVLGLFSKPEFQLKLIEVENLIIDESYIHTMESSDIREENFIPETRIIEVDDEMHFKFRTVEMPLSHIPMLRPILVQVTGLKIAVQRYTRDLNPVVDAIRSLANTLVYLAISGPIEYWPPPPFLQVHHPPVTPLPAIRQCAAITLPALKSLKFERISENNCRDILQNIQCPALEEIDVAGTIESEARRKEIYDSSLYVSVDFLHERLPSLKCLHINTHRTQDGLTMLADLAKPGAEGQWQLPHLEIIVLDSVRKKPTLPTLTEIIVNRLIASRQVKVACIRSVTLPGFEECYEGTLQEAYLSTLNLLVPEVKITEACLAERSLATSFRYL